MTPELEKLIANARTFRVSDGDREIQRISFAYGNAALANSKITREMVADASAQLRKKIAEGQA